MTESQQLQPLDTIKNHFKQARLRLKAAEALVASQMAICWNNLTELRTLFHSIPDCDIKVIIFNQIRQLELLPKNQRGKA